MAVGCVTRAALIGLSCNPDTNSLAELTLCFPFAEQALNHVFIIIT